VSAPATPPTAPVAEGLEQTLMPSPNVRTLDPTARIEYQTRLGDARGTLAETYHLRSRLRPWELDRLPSEADVQALRDWLHASGRTYGDDVVAEGRAGLPVRDLQELPQPVGAFLAAFCRGQGAAMYAADVTVVHHDELALLTPAGGLVVERSLGADSLTRLAQQVHREQRGAVETAGCVLAVMTVPWRQMVLYGERGFRRALMETGILVASLCGVAAQAGLRPTPIVDFADAEVDALLFNDGVERFCAALVALETEALA